MNKVDFLAGYIEKSADHESRGRGFESLLAHQGQPAAVLFFWLFFNYRIYTHIQFVAYRRKL